jgi:predicted ribosome quality control (RQC) complex YloA/Tae2 family protein
LVDPGGVLVVIDRPAGDRAAAEARDLAFDAVFDDVCRELLPILVGAHVQEVDSHGDRGLILHLRNRRAKHAVVFDVSRGRARVHRLDARADAENPRRPFAARVRDAIAGLHIVRVRRSTTGVALELGFAAQGPDEARPPASVNSIDAVLLFDLRGGVPSLRLLSGTAEELARIPGTLRERRDDSVTGRPRVESSLSSAEPAITELVDVTAGSRTANDTIPESFPCNSAVSRASLAIETRIALTERQEKLARRLAKESARRRRILDGIAKDLEGAARGVEAQKTGELLKAELRRIVRGMASIEVVDYYSPGLERITLALDPRISPQENVETWFRRARKCRRALEFLTERQARIAVELATLEQASARLDAAGTLDEIHTLEADLAPLLVAKEQRAGTRRKVEAGPQGPRRFSSVDGIPILVGRNAIGNDRLTFRLARGNDLFLHVAGRPGAHVIVRSRPGESVPLTTMLDAAQLALWYSLPERSGGALHQGARADIDYTQVKHVMKPRGAKPGAVLLRNHKTLHIELDAERIENLRAGAGGEGAGGGRAGGAD